MSLEELHAGKILIVHQGALGDFILTLPAIMALREFLQPVWLEIMGHPWILQLVEGRYYADGIRDVNRAEIAPFFHEGAQLPEKMCGYFQKFDAAFVFGKGVAFERNLQRAGVKRVFLLSPYPEGKRHMIEHHICSLRALGIPSTPAPPRVFLQEEDRSWAKQFLRQRGWEQDGIIALHPGAGSSKKVWPPERFASVGRALAEDGWRLVIIQGPADEQVVQEMLGGLNGIPHLVLRDLPLIKLGALLSCTSIFIGNDSGISHLAASLGVTTVTLFGPTDPEVWAPRGEKAFWLRGQADCSPCSLQQRNRCKRPRCMEGIEVKDLMELLVEIIKISRERAVSLSKRLSHHSMGGMSLSQH